MESKIDEYEMSLKRLKIALAQMAIEDVMKMLEEEDSPLEDDDSMQDFHKVLDHLSWLRKDSE